MVCFQLISVEQNDNPILSLSRPQALDSDLEIQPDLPQALKLIHEMNDNVKQVTSLVESMLEKVRSGELSTEYGLSFLEVKYHMLLDYLINLTYIVLRKTSGEYLMPLFSNKKCSKFYSQVMKSMEIQQ